MNAYKKILLPIDFSPACELAAERARDMAEFYGAELSAIHVIDYLPPAYVTVELPKELSSKEFLLEKATTHLKEWVVKNGLEKCERIIETGQPKKVLTQIIKDREFDLVILVPHTDSAFVRFFGSVTNAVAQNTECDVLILRDKA